MQGEMIPRLIAWEITRSCPLSCRHCRAAAQNVPYEGELGTDECKALLDNIRTLGQPIIILTGGEPMLREDVYEIARYGTDIGLRMVMAPCGAYVDAGAVERIKAAGIERISLSIDGADREQHDAFRGVDGAFDQVMAAARAAREGGLSFQINSTISRINRPRLLEIYRLAIDLGAAAFHPFLLVPMGRGEELKEYELSAQEYEDTLHEIYRLSREAPIPFKPTCAPHYYRILRQEERAAGRTVTPETHGLDAHTRGCLGGQGFAFISHTGRVQLCGFLEESAGELKEHDLDFAHIWRHSPLFAAVRDRKRYEGKCGVCEYHRFCGGCRARAQAITGNYLASEPYCVYEPRGGRH